MSRLNGSGDSIVQQYIVCKESNLPNFLLVIAVFVILFYDDTTLAEKATLSEAMSEKSIGDPNAPVTVIEY